MKTIVVTILLACIVLYADAVIIEFSGEPSQDKIILSWKTGQETDLDLFVVERSSNKKDFNKSLRRLRVSIITVCASEMKMALFSCPNRLRLYSK